MAESASTIAVIGNCQSEIITECLSVMLPHHHIRAGFSKNIAKGRVDLNDLIDSSDTLLVQTTMTRRVQKAARDMGKKTILVSFPEIYFTGFHPDMTPAGDAKSGTEVLTSSMGKYHSAICLYGWLNGLSQDQVISLFRDEVFEHLGYYDHIRLSRDALLKAAGECGLDLGDSYDRWLKTGRFMHNVNHPKPFVLAELSRKLAEKLGIKPEIQFPEHHLPDTLQHLMVWAFYPEVAASMGMAGEYIFSQKNGVKTAQGTKVRFGLEDFVFSSYDAYEGHDRSQVTAIRLKDERYGALKKFLKRPHASKKSDSSNPYRNLPDHQFWNKAVVRPAMGELDPVIGTSFQIAGDTKVATAGSCFAQHIARTLQKSGYLYYVTERGEAIPEQERILRNFGVFSARYGNLYTARQLLQLFDRAYGTFVPRECVWAHDELGFVDAFRPQVEPDGFESEAGVEESRATHLALVRNMFETLDVFVFTLGLTESWVSKDDGAVYPLAPGVAGGVMDTGKYEFVNFTVQETIDDLNSFVAKLRKVNPASRVILTVSPVPLIATYEPRHVLVSTTYSKSVLRVAAETIARSNSEVDYFPSYEIITGSYNRGAYFEADLRSVTEAGVAHVMRTFLHHYSTATRTAAKPPVDDALAAEIAQGREIVCDEEAIVAPSGG